MNQRLFMLKRLSQFIFLFTNGNVFIFFTFLCIAVLVIISRSLAAYEVLIDDMGVQIEAGYRLVSGLGLTHSSFDLSASLGDINQPIERKYLTWFPPFFSLYVAGVLLLGFSLVTSLKLLFAFVTLVGWVGWAAVGSRIMKRPLDLKLVTVPAHFVIACLLPLLFTPAWQGTDIILWAGTPFVVLLLLYTLEYESQWKYVVAAGLLSGFLCSVRYASAYLTIAALLIIAQFFHKNSKKILSLYTTFMASSMVLILPTALYVKYAKAQTAGITEYIRLDPSLVIENLKIIIYAVSYSLSPYFFWIPPSIRIKIFQINGDPLFQIVFSVLAVLLLFLSPIFFLCYAGERRDEKEATQSRIVVELSMIMLSLLLFLTFASAFMVKEQSINGYSFVSDWRYYVPAGGASIFILYYLCTHSVVKWWAVVSKRLSSFIIIGIIIYCFSLPVVAFLLPNQHISVLIKKWLTFHTAGTMPGRTYPSNEMIRPDKTIRLIQELSAAEPSAVFFITPYYNILFDNFNPQLRYFWIGSAKVVLNGAYISRNTKIYFVLRAHEAIDKDFSTILAKAGFQESMSISEDGIKIFQTQLPSGFSFSSILSR
jgi:hypothetical protein